MLNNTQQSQDVENVLDKSNGSLCEVLPNSLLYKVLPGSEFNSLYDKTKFYKFLNNDLTHNKFKYDLGLNVDFMPFISDGECSSGGLYFCEESKCHMFARIYGSKLGFVEIPDDARVYTEQGKFKADKLILTKIIDFDKIDDSFWINMLHQNGLVLQYVKSQTEDICSLAVKQDCNALRFVKPECLTNNICRLAVQQNGWSLQYVPPNLRTDEICNIAISNNAWALEFVESQTEEMCCLAVSAKAFSLESVKEQTEKICCLAVQQNGLALTYVDKQTYEICKLAVQQNGMALEFVKNTSNLLTAELCILAINQNCLAIEFVPDSLMLPNGLYKVIVQQNGLLLRFLINTPFFLTTNLPFSFFTEEICKLAVIENGLALEFVKNQTAEICILAVQQNNDALCFVKDPSSLPSELLTQLMTNQLSNILSNIIIDEPSLDEKPSLDEPTDKLVEELTELFKGI